MRHVTIAVDLVAAAVLALGAAAVLALGAASAGAASAGAAAKPDGLVVLAAPSLTEALGDLGRSFSDHRHTEAPVFDFTTLEAMRKRLSHPGVDVVATSDTSEINALWRAGLVAEPHLIAHNVIGIVAAAHDSDLIAYPNLARPGLKLVVAATATALGRYTEVAYMRIAGIQKTGRRVVTAMRANVVAHVPGEREVLARVMSGEADAGFVYITDIDVGGSKVRSVSLPELMSPRIPCSIAAVTNGSRRADADAFVEYASGDDGGRIMQRHGFLP